MSDASAVTPPRPRLVARASCRAEGCGQTLEVSGDDHTVVIPTLLQALEADGWGTLATGLRLCPRCAAARQAAAPA